jgi:hypothetical protein
MTRLPLERRHQPLLKLLLPILLRSSPLERMVLFRSVSRIGSALQQTPIHSPHSFPSHPQLLQNPNQLPQNLNVLPLPRPMKEASDRLCTTPPATDAARELRAFGTNASCAPTTICAAPANWRRPSTTLPPTPSSSGLRNPLPTIPTALAWEDGADVTDHAAARNGACRLVVDALLPLPTPPRPPLPLFPSLPISISISLPAILVLSVTAAKLPSVTHDSSV